MKEINRKRLLELSYIISLGDGVLMMLFPSAHMHLWRNVLPFRWWRRSSDWFEEHPTATRLFGLIEAIISIRGLQRILRDV